MPGKLRFDVLGTSAHTLSKVYYILKIHCRFVGCSALCWNFHYQIKLHYESPLKNVTFVMWSNEMYTLYEVKYLKF